MDIDFNNIESIKQVGYTGFIPIRNLYLETTRIPKVRGVYFIIYNGYNPPAFLPIGSGGHFKGRNPNVSISELQSNWVENTKVIYIGKAGGAGSSATLQSRLRQYLRFGQGKPVGHWGGRLIWQIKNSGDLNICWKPLPKEEPRVVEGDLIQQFKSIYGKRPFANLSD